MADEILKRDQNSAVVLGGVTDDASQEIRMLRVDPVTGRLLVSGTGGGGTIVVTDGSTTVNNVTTIDFTSGAIVTDLGGGIVGIAVSGGGFTELPATGTVDGTNAAFTFTQQPSYIVSDGAWYKKLDNNGNTQWSWSAGTATMTIPPNSSIFGIA